MRLEDPSSYALFLDLDGTLIDIAPTPDDIVIPPDLVPLLTRLAVGLGGAIGIISGRQVEEIDRLLAPLKLIAAGVHGAELRTAVDDEVHRESGPMNPDIVAAVSALPELIPGLIVERKGTSVAVHYRLAPEAGPFVERELRRILEARSGHFIICPGRRVFEVVPRHISKGAALEALHLLPAFRGKRPIMIGDDVTDETALAAARRLDGLGLRVAGEHFSRESSDFNGTAHVRAWLADLAGQLDG